MTPDKPLEKWTVAEFKAELKRRNLPVNGLKAELMARLQEAMDGGNSAAGDDVAADEGATALNAQSGDDAPEHMELGEKEDVDPAEKAEAGTDEKEPAAAASPDGQEEASPMQEDEKGGEEPKEEPAAAEEASADQQHEEPPAEPDYGPEEWERMDIPEDWLPAPIVRVRNVPANSSTDDLKQVIEACGVTVKSIVFESEKKDGKQTALLRFPPLPLPWTLTEEDLAAPLLSAPAEANKEEKEEPAGQPDKQEETPMQAEAEAAPEAAAPEAAAPEAAAPEAAAAPAAEAVAQPEHHEDDTKSTPSAVQSKVTVVPPKQVVDDGRRDGDAMKMARFLANHLARNRLQMGGQALQIDALPLPVTLFLGNLIHDQDEKLRAEMEQYGSIERCFIMRTTEGASKGYGFVEYSLPAAAIKAKDSLEDIFRKAFNEHQAKRMSIAKLKAQLKHKASVQAKVEDAAHAPQEAAKHGEGEEAKAEVAQVEAKEEEPAAKETVEEAAKEEEAKEEQEVKEEQEPKEEQEAKEEEAKEEQEVKEEAKEEAAAAKEEEASAMDTKAEAKSDEPVVGAAPAEAAPEEEEAAPKIMRAEAMHVRTVYSLFGRSLYIANLPQGRFEEEKDLKATFETFGPINGLTIVRHNGVCKGFGFVEFKRSDHATAALKGMEGHAHPAFGKLSVSFQNPAKLGAKQSGGSGGQQGQSGRGGRANYQGAGRGGGRGSWYQSRGGAGFGGRGMVGMYGNRAVMSPMYGGRGGGGYGYAQPAGYGYGRSRGGGGGGGGYGSGSGYGMAGYGTGRSSGYAARGPSGYGAAPAAPASGYGQRAGYGMPAAAAGYGASGYSAPRGGAAYSGATAYAGGATYSGNAGYTGGYAAAAAPSQGYSSQQPAYASSGYRAPPAAPMSYASPRQQSTAYGSPVPYRAQAASGYAAAPAATGYGAPQAPTGYAAAPATGYGTSGYGPTGYGSAAPKRPSDQSYPAYGSTGYGGSGYQQGQDYKRGRY